MPARDIGIVTAEIKEIRRDANNMALMYAIEIGRRLVEAKSVLPHGEWGDWLKNEVDFSVGLWYNGRKNLPMGECV